MASLYGATDVVHYLCEKGADINSVCSQGLTPLSAACSNGNADIVRYLIEKGADPNVQDRRLWTATHQLAFLNMPDLLALLKDSGADFSLQNDQHDTPLDIAVSQGKTEAAEYLRSIGAPANNTKSTCIVI